MVRPVLGQGRCHARCVLLFDVVVCCCVVVVSTPTPPGALEHFSL